MKKTTLRKYARLIAQCGVNVQKGQEVFITAGLDQPDFVKMVAEECYKLGATRVVVDFDYQPLTKLHVKYCSLETLGGLTDYQKARFEHYVEKLPCRIYLESDDPDGLKGINQHKMLRAQQMRYPLIKGYRDEMENKYQWCIAAVPGPAWAKKLFPDTTKRQAMEKLWDAILATSRVTEYGDPVDAWDRHNADLMSRCKYLNSLGIEKLHYTSSNGTDLTVGMIPEAVFKGGRKLLVCGNAPTFLIPLLNMPAPPSDIAVVGVPVGFVNVVEAKERLFKSGLPCIVAMGRRGGSAVAAAIVNALLYGMEGVRA